MKEQTVQFKSYGTLPKEMRSAVKEMYQIHMMVFDKDKRNVWLHVSDRINPNDRFYIQLTIIPNVNRINRFIDKIPGFQTDKMIYDVQYELKMNFFYSSDKSYAIVSYMFEDTLNEIKNEYLCIGFEYLDGWYGFPNTRFDKIFSLKKNKEFDVFENECLMFYLTFRANEVIETGIPLYDIDDISRAMSALESLNDAMKNEDTMKYVDGLIRDSIRKSNESLLREEKGPIKPRLIKIYKTINPLWFIPVSI